jgi:protein gp37
MMLACHVLTNIPDHTFIVLTKRHERMLEYFTARKSVELLKAWADKPRVTLDNPDVLFEELVYSATCHDWDKNGTNSSGSEYKPWGYLDKLWPLPNVIGMVTAENQEMANLRVPYIIESPFAVRGVSVEPMLSAIDFSRWIGEYYCSNCHYRGFEVGPEDEDGEDTCPKCGSGEWWFTEAEYHGGLEAEERQPLKLIICGGESGPGRRETKIEWIRGLRDQCRAAGVDFFLKQMQVGGKLVKMPELDGVRHAGFPEVRT